MSMEVSRCVHRESGRHARTQNKYVAGMPELAYTGLSENWLFKTCGDRHWQSLAQEAGLSEPEFRDADGNPVYAAFTAVSLREAALEALGENDRFSIRSTLTSSGGAHYFSTHEVEGSTGSCARVSMASTFIRRQREGDNRTVVKAMPIAIPGSRRAITVEAQELVMLRRRFRAGNWGAHLGLEQLSSQAHHVADFVPCPYNDFNGANLLYFASFQAMVDRVEWGWKRSSSPPVVAARDLFFHGNVNIGDALELSFSVARQDADGLSHWCEIRRLSDGEKVADVITVKRWRS